MKQSNLADLVNRLNVGLATRSKNVDVPFFMNIFKILFKMQQMGLIRYFRVIDGRTVRVFLKYKHDRLVVKKFQLVSKPSSRAYATLEKLVNVKTKMRNVSYYIVSTNKGLLTEYECLYYNVSGEVLMRAIY